MEMCKEKLLELCKEHDLYRTPYLNEKLFLQYQGFDEIKNLEEYTGLTSLWLQGNSLREIQNLNNQTKLKSLFLQENCISELNGLFRLSSLTTLNLSQNMITDLRGIEKCMNISTLYLKKNLIKEVDKVRPLTKLPLLSCLDLSENSIEDIRLLDVLKDCSAISCIYLQGNAVTKRLTQYRNNVIFSLPNLTFLDKMPVFQEERMRSKAFMTVYIESEGNLDLARGAMKEVGKKIRDDRKIKEKCNRAKFWQLVKQANEGDDTFDKENFNKNNLPNLLTLEQSLPNENNRRRLSETEKKRILKPINKP